MRIIHLIVNNYSACGLFFSGLMLGAKHPRAVTCRRCAATRIFARCSAACKVARRKQGECFIQKELI
jgi:hypothetical protein